MRGRPSLPDPGIKRLSICMKDFTAIELRNPAGLPNIVAYALPNMDISHHLGLL
jgi:hypothetical protein